MPKRKKKAYIVVDTIHSYMQGAFPFDESGKKNAKELIDKLEKESNTKFVIKTK